MCEYIASTGEGPAFRLPPGVPVDIGGMEIVSLKEKGNYYECWHPETDGWEIMLPPPPGMSLFMPPGSRIRMIEGERPNRPTLNAPPEAGRQMREVVG